MVRIDEGSWQPLLEGGLAEQARQAIEDIVEALEALEGQSVRDDPSLAAGAPGLALFHSVGLARRTRRRRRPKLPTPLEPALRFEVLRLF